MNPVDVSELLEHLHAAYPNQRVADEGPVIWFQHLTRVDVLDARTAAYRWIDTELWFPSIAAFLAYCDTETRATRLAEIPVHSDDRAVTYRCQCGAMQGWVEEADGRLHPCPACRPEQHAWWRAGHFDLGHSCMDCARKRVGA